MASSIKLCHVVVAVLAASLVLASHSTVDAQPAFFSTMQKWVNHLLNSFAERRSRLILSLGRLHPSLHHAAEQLANNRQDYYSDSGEEPVYYHPVPRSDMSPPDFDVVDGYDARPYYYQEQEEEPTDGAAEHEVAEYELVEAYDARPFYYQQGEKGQAMEKPTHSQRLRAAAHNHAVQVQELALKHHEQEAEGGFRSAPQWSQLYEQAVPLTNDWQQVSTGNDDGSSVTKQSPTNETTEEQPTEGENVQIQYIYVTENGQEFTSEEVQAHAAAGQAQGWVGVGQEASNRRHFVVESSGQRFHPGVKNHHVPAQGDNVWSPVGFQYEDYAEVVYPVEEYGDEQYADYTTEVVANETTPEAPGTENPTTSPPGVAPSEPPTTTKPVAEPGSGLNSYLYPPLGSKRDPKSHYLLEFKKKTN